MNAISTGLEYTDVRFLGYPHIIATAILQGGASGAGVGLVDPGPQTSLETLQSNLAEHGIGLQDLTDLIITHIHLDHSGGAGHLVRANPRIQVHVHAVGAPHMVDPTRLIKSASRLYGNDMQRLWGEILPVPATNVRALAGGERLVVAGRGLRVAYTPGHASHHVSYLDEASGVAFVGDTLGVRRAPSTYVMPATPPPDVDLRRWPDSIQRILSWKPSAVFLTHFGPFDNVRAHADEFLERTNEWANRVRLLLAEPDLTEAQRCDRLVEDVRKDLRRQMSSDEADAYDRAGRIDYSWQGLARAISKEM